MQIYGLKCQQLQVGDVCISLYAGNSKSQTNPATPQPQQPHHQQSNHHHHQLHQPQLPAQHQQATPSTTPCIPNSTQQQQLCYQYSCYRDDYPQNLSRRSQTVPTTATGTTVTSRPMLPQHMDNHHQQLTNHSIQGQLRSNSSSSSSTSSLDDRRSSSSTSSSQSHSYDSRSYLQLQQHQQQHQQYLSSDNCITISRPSSNQGATISTGSNSTSSSPPSSSSLSTPTSGSGIPMVIQRTLSEEIALEAAASRKRRWSAPDNIRDDDNVVGVQQPKQQPPPPPTINNKNH